MGWALLCQSLIKKCTTAFPTVQSWSGIFLNQGPLLTDDYSLGQDNIKLASTERSGSHFWVFVWLTVQRDKVSHGGRHGTLRLATKVCSWPGSRQRWMLVFSSHFTFQSMTSAQEILPTFRLSLSSPSLPLEAPAYTHLEVRYYGDSKSGQVINEDEPSWHNPWQLGIQTHDITAFHHDL